MQRIGKGRKEAGSAERQREIKEIKRDKVVNPLRDTIFIKISPGNLLIIKSLCLKQSGLFMMSCSASSDSS